MSQRPSHPLPALPAHPPAAGAVLVGTIDHTKLQGWSAEDVLALLRQAAADPAAASLSGLVEANEVTLMSAAGQLPPILCTDETMAGVWHEFDTSDAAAVQQEAAAASSTPHLRMAAQALRARQQRLAQEPQPGTAEETAEEAAAAASAAAAAAGPSSGSQQRQVLSAGIVSWRPLLWFKFHSAEEAVGFVQRNRPLVERHGAQATVRHSGPAPTRRGHATAQAAAEATAAATAAAAGGHALHGAPAPDPQVLAVAQMLHQQVHQAQHHQHPHQQPAQQAQQQQGQQQQQQAGQAPPAALQPGQQAAQQQAQQPEPMLQEQQQQQQQQQQRQLPQQMQAVGQPPLFAHQQQAEAEAAGAAAAPHWLAGGLAGGPAAGGAPEVPLHSQSDSEDESEGSDGLGVGGDDDLSGQCWVLGNHRLPWSRASLGAMPTTFANAQCRVPRMQAPAAFASLHLLPRPSCPANLVLCLQTTASLTWMRGRAHRALGWPTGCRTSLAPTCRCASTAAIACCLVWCARQPIGLMAPSAELGVDLLLSWELLADATWHHWRDCSRWCPAATCFRDARHEQHTHLPVFAAERPTHPALSACSRAGAGCGGGGRGATV